MEHLACLNAQSAASFSSVVSYSCDQVHSPKDRHYDFDTGISPESVVASLMFTDTLSRVLHQHHQA